MAVDARQTRTLTACAATLCIALLGSACGSGSSGGNGIAHVGTTGTTGTSTSAASAKADPAKFASCMRKHGVTGFPDPDSKGRIKVTGGVLKDGTRVGIDPNSQQWRTAMRSCQQFEPNGGKQDPKKQAAMVKAALAFSSCMRSHGVPKFPDPEVTSNGGMMQRLGGPGSGIDPSSPTFQTAQQACQKLNPDGPQKLSPKGGGGGSSNSTFGGPSSASSQ
jgi:hypothetical protein